jgi:hypothetical protein
MEVVCASCGRKHRIPSGVSTLPQCECGGTTWRSEPDVLLGVVAPPSWVYDPDSSDQAGPLQNTGTNG